MLKRRDGWPRIISLEHLTRKFLGIIVRRSVQVWILGQERDEIVVRDLVTKAGDQRQYGVDRPCDPTRVAGQ